MTQIVQHAQKTQTATPADEFGIARRMLFAYATMGLLVIGCGGWAATADLAGAVISHGSVVVGQHVKKVQHREGGIIAAINVKNGDKVSAGDTLLQLDDTQIKAELGIIQAQLIELRTRQARFTAERDGAATITFPADLTSVSAAQRVMAGEAKLFIENRKSRESQKQQLEQRVAQLGEETNGIGAQRDAKKVELKLIRKELEKVRELEAKKLTPQTRVYALEREEARIAGEHGNLIAQGARAAGQIAEIQLQILNLDQTARTDAQRELRTAEARVAELVEREVAAKDRLSRMEIKAPYGGVAHQLGVHTVGGVVSAADPILLIVPEGEALAIELKIAPNDIDQIYLGQEVRLRFTAFNQRTTPEVKGQISYIAADVTQDPKGRADYFAVRALLDNTNGWRVADKDITPGMPVEAFLATGKRTALTYLTKPITDQFTRTFREK